MMMTASTYSAVRTNNPRRWAVLLHCFIGGETEAAPRLMPGGRPRAVRGRAVVHTGNAEGVSAASTGTGALDGR